MNINNTNNSYNLGDYTLRNITRKYIPDIDRCGMVMHKFNEKEQKWIDCGFILWIIPISIERHENLETDEFSLTMKYIDKFGEKTKKFEDFIDLERFVSKNGYKGGTGRYWSECLSLCLAGFH